MGIFDRAKDVSDRGQRRDGSDLDRDFPPPGRDRMSEPEAGEESAADRAEVDEPDRTATEQDAASAQRFAVDRNGGDA